MEGRLLDTVISPQAHLMSGFMTASVTEDDGGGGRGRSGGAMRRDRTHRTRDQPYPQEDLAASPVNNHAPPGLGPLTARLQQLTTEHVVEAGPGAVGQGYQSLEDAFASERRRMADRMARLAQAEVMLATPTLAAPATATAPAPPPPLPVVGPASSQQHERQCILCHMDTVREVPKEYTEFIERLRDLLRTKTPEAVAMYGRADYAKHVKPVLDEVDPGPGDDDDGELTVALPEYNVAAVALHLGSTIYTFNSEHGTDLILRDLEKMRCIVQSRIVPVNPHDGIDIKAGELFLKLSLACIAQNDKRDRRPRFAHSNVQATTTAATTTARPRAATGRRRPPPLVNAWLEQQATTLAAAAASTAPHPGAAAAHPQSTTRS